MNHSHLRFVLLGCMLCSWTVVRADRPRHAPPVPPSQEIEILDPNADPLGIPAVQLNKARCEEGVQTVDIPPVVLVHRFYYTGDRNFQGPMLPGGPSVVVANHPRSGERCYINVQLLPGAPRVRYTSSSIEYDYGRELISVDFPWLGSPKVRFRNGPAMGSQIAATGKAVSQRTHDWLERTGLPAATKKSRATVHQASLAAADSIHKVGQLVAAPIVQAAHFIPFGSAAVSSLAPDRQAENMRNLQVNSAVKQSQFDNASIQTLR